MYSPYSSDDSDSSASSADSYYDRRSHRRPHRSKNRKAHKLFEDDTIRYSKEARKMSPLPKKYSMQLSLSDEKAKAYRKKHSPREHEEPTVSRKELNEIKRLHKKEIKHLLKFLQKESSLVSGIEEEKKEEMYEIKRKHEKEVEKLFGFQEKELTMVSEEYAREQADLEDRLERTKSEANEELRMCKDHALILTEDLQSTTQKFMYEMRELQDELSTSVRQNSILESEVRVLNGQLAEKDKYIRRLEAVSAKSSSTEEKMRAEIRQRDDEIRRRDDEIRHKDQAIVRKNEEIHSLGSKNASSRERVESININGSEWEETSGLTWPSEFDIRKDSLEQYHPKLPPKYRFSPDRGRKTVHSSSRRRDYRDDLETRALSVSFSDEVEKRLLPMQAHDNLSRRLEKMYLDS